MRSFNGAVLNNKRFNRHSWNWIILKQ